MTMMEIGKMIREEGIEEEKKQGKKEVKYEIIIKLLIQKFKELPEECIDKIKSLSYDTIETIVTDIFDMKSTEDLKKYFSSTSSSAKNTGHRRKTK